MNQFALGLYIFAALLIIVGGVYFGYVASTSGLDTTTIVIFVAFLFAGFVSLFIAYQIHSKPHVMID